MKHLLTLSFCLVFTSINLFAQPGNDECATLIDLGEAPVCPPPGVYTNLNATSSTISPVNQPACFNGGGTQNDVWFELLAD